MTTGGWPSSRSVADTVIELFGVGVGVVIFADADAGRGCWTAIEACLVLFSGENNMVGGLLFDLLGGVKGERIGDRCESGGYRVPPGVIVRDVPALDDTL